MTIEEILDCYAAGRLTQEHAQRWLEMAGCTIPIDELAITRERISQGMY